MRSDMAEKNSVAGNEPVMDADYEHLSLEVKRLLARVDMHAGYGHYRAAQETMNEAVEKLTDLETLLGKLEASPLR